MKLPCGKGGSFPVKRKEASGGTRASFLMESDEASRWKGSTLPGGNGASFPVKRKILHEVGRSYIFLLYTFILQCTKNFYC